MGFGFQTYKEGNKRRGIKKKIFSTNERDICPAHDLKLDFGTKKSAINETLGNNYFSSQRNVAVFFLI